MTQAIMKMNRTNNRRQKERDIQSQVSSSSARANHGALDELKCVSAVCIGGYGNGKTDICITKRLCAVLTPVIIAKLN